MSEVGKNVRMERIINRKTGKTILVPMDHGVSSGPIKGLIDMPAIVNKVAEGGANAVLLHKGIVRHAHRGYGKDIGLILHLSGSTSLGPDPNNKVLVTTVEEALKLGADIVKTNYTGDPDTFREVTKGCPVPVVIAGGPKMTTPQDVLEMLKDSVEAGGAGASIGRNVFQAQDPTKMVRAIARIVHEGYTASMKEIQ